MKVFFRIIRTVIYVPLFIFLFGWIALRTKIFDPKPGVIFPSWSLILGIILMIVGGVLVLICVIVFVDIGKGTPAVFDPPTEFVAIGPYTIVRNPMYIGGLILLDGFGLFHNSLSILIFSVLLIILFHLFVVFVEEPTLEKQFGKTYIDYKNKVNRWIPKLK